MNKIQLVLWVVVFTTTQVFGFTDAASFGFSPNANGVDNVKALQTAVDKGGTIVVSQPGTYKISGTTFIGDNTSLVFGAGVVLEKSNENGPFAHVFLNRGAISRTYNHNISITGLDLRINGVDRRWDPIYGLRGHVAFFYVKDLKIERTRISGLVNGQFALHICTFEDLLINDVIIKGKKDGIHLGPGKRFKISNCYLNISNCTFTNPGINTIVTNSSPGKEIFLKTSGSLEVGKGFSAIVNQGPEIIHVDSDLTGLKK